MKAFKFTLTLIYLLVLPALVHAQILVPDVVKPNTPIEGICECALPSNGKIDMTWSVDPQSFLKEVPGKAAGFTNIHVWAAPGPHWMKVRAVTTFYQDIVVWVPDDKNPDDITKAKKQTLHIIVRQDVQDYQKNYTVGDAPLPPDPTPNPNPTPDPTPATGFAGKVQEWAKAAGVNKADLSIIGDNYLSVGSQGTDPARSTGWDLAAFVTQTKTLNVQTLGVDKLSAYKGKFFDELAKYQNELFKQRGLTPTDREGLAKLWTETGEAMKEAAKKLP